MAAVVAQELHFDQARAAPPADPSLAPASRRWPVIVVAVYVLVLATHGISTSDLYRNEGLRALIAAEMLRTGDGVVPTLHCEPHLTKPPGMYVAIALASAPFGAVTPWSARLPSVLAALLTTFFAYRTLRRCIDARGGLLAAAILPVSLLWLDRTPSAEIDMVQLAWVSAALFAFLRALEISESAGPRLSEWFWWQLALGCVAGGLLTKWTAPAFFYLTVVPLLWWRGRLRMLMGAPHLFSVGVAALPCLAWIAAVCSRVGWAALVEAVSREALLRVSPAHHPRPYPWIELAEFPLTFLAACLPWSAVAVVTLRPTFAALWDERGRRLLQLLHCWLWPSLLFWTILPGHRPRHCLPLQPAIAALAALVWIAWIDGRLRWPLRHVDPRPLLVGFLAFWLVVKATHVHSMASARGGEQGWTATAARLAALVPAGEPIHINRLKDDGLLFHTGRLTRRFSDPPRSSGTICLLTADEWQQWPAVRPAEVLMRLSDGQGDPLVLVRLP